MYGASRLRQLCITLCMGALVLQTPNDCRAIHTISAMALKAVLLYKLPRFIYWPAEISDLEICVFQDPDLTKALEKLARRSLDRRSIRIRPLTDLDDIKACQLIFIPRERDISLEELLKKLTRSRAVTVSDIEGFARAGGIVEFAPKPNGKGMRILINLSAAKQKQIRFNAQLLRLATLLNP